MTQTGQQGNAWNAASTASVSSPIQLPNSRLITIFGHVSGAVTITLQFSADGVNFYDSASTITAAGAADIGASFDCAANWVRLKASATVTATISIAAS